MAVYVAARGYPYSAMPFVDQERGGWDVKKPSCQEEGGPRIPNICWADVPEQLEIGVLHEDIDPADTGKVKITLRRNHVCLKVKGVKVLNARLTHDVDPHKSSWRLGAPILN